MERCWYVVSQSLVYNSVPAVCMRCSVAFTFGFACCTQALATIKADDACLYLIVLFSIEQSDDEPEDELPLDLRESSTSGVDWCNGYFHRPMALPGLDPCVFHWMNSAEHSRNPALIQRNSLDTCCCDCHSCCELTAGRLPHQRCRITEIPDETAREIIDEAETNDNTSTALVPMNTSVTARRSMCWNERTCSGRTQGHNMSLVNYTRLSDSVVTSSDQPGSTQQNSQIQGPLSRSRARVHRLNSCPHNYRRYGICHQQIGHHGRPGIRTSRIMRQERSRQATSTVMPLSAWNLRRMQFPLPLEPPPPYRPWQLPPYLEDDPAPSYRSRAPTPANSISMVFHN